MFTTKQCFLHGTYPYCHQFSILIICLNFIFHCKIKSFVFVSVKPGETVVTWQFVFTCEQLNHRAKFYSNLLADTRSSDDVPEDLAGTGF